MDELLNRKMPSSIEAEQSVLGAILIDPQCTAEVVGILKADDFYMEQNRQIYETIYSMFSYSQAIDPVTVLDRMRVDGTYKEGVTREYVMQLMEITPTAANVREYARIVRDKAVLRSVAQAVGEINDMIFDGGGNAADILEAAERKIYAIRNDRANQSMEHISTVILQVYDRLSELSRAGNKIPGISTGLAELDNFTSGLNKGDLVLLAARPGMGKTSLALNIALHAGKHSGKTVAIFSLEMSKEQLAMRLISDEAFVDGKKLNTGNLSDDDWAKIAAASAALGQTDIRIEDNPTLSVADMNARCRRLDQLGLIIIDYLQLMQSSGNSGRGDNRQQIVSDISRALKIMAKELNVPVLCLSQLSRANESRSDKRPMLSDLRESGAIEQDADIVMFLYRDDYYNEDSEQAGIAECIIAKNRHGNTGKVELQWLPEFTTFASREWKHDDKDAY